MKIRNLLINQLHAQYRSPAIVKMSRANLQIHQEL